MGVGRRKTYRRQLKAPSGQNWNYLGNKIKYWIITQSTEYPWHNTDASKCLNK